ncbi:MAG: dihydrofolate reductase family protein [Micromonosporaceae bacterium]
MRKISVFNSVTLDGVMQAPGGPDEDTRGGFSHGGWAVPYHDDVMMREASKGMGTTELLLGRLTYEKFYAYWPHQKDNPFTDVLNNSQKYVASTTLAEPLEWQNSTLLSGDATAAVGKLKEQPGKDLVVLGSGALISSIADLIDEYVVLIHPLVLGSGRRLFADGAATAKLKLVDSVPTTTGVIIATYHRIDA